MMAQVDETRALSSLMISASHVPGASPIEIRLQGPAQWSSSGSSRAGTVRHDNNVSLIPVPHRLWNARRLVDRIC